MTSAEDRAVGAPPVGRFAIDAAGGVGVLLASSFMAWGVSGLVGVIEIGHRDVADSVVPLIAGALAALATAFALGFERRQSLRGGLRGLLVLALAGVAAAGAHLSPLAQAPWAPALAGLGGAAAAGAGVRIWTG